MLVAVFALSACETIGFGKFTKRTKISAADEQGVEPLELPPPLVMNRDEPSASTVASRQRQAGATLTARPAPPAGTYIPGDIVPRRGDWNAPDSAAAPQSTPRVAALPPPSPAAERLLVPGEPAQVQQQVRKFWDKLGVAIARDDIAAGVIDTNWIASYLDVLAGNPSAPSSGISLLDRFTVVLTPGSAPSTTSVVVQHHGMQERAAANWEPRPSEPRLEHITLERLKTFLSAS